MKRFAVVLTALLLTCNVTLLAVPAVAHADFKTDACQGVSQVQSGSCSANASRSVGHILKFVINILSVIVGFAAVVMIIFAGFKYISAGGDSGSIANAKTTLVYAIVGLFIVGVAQALVHFALSEANRASKAGGVLYTAISTER